MLSIGSCFSGIGGLELGLEWTGEFQTKWQIENDEYASRVLSKHWPGVKRYSDIRDVVRPEPVDLICGGFPCQDVSIAGARKGLGGKRSTLWSEMFRLVCEVRPRWVVAENVPGLLSSDNGRFFGNILRDLAGAGYDAEWKTISAKSIGAMHRRERIFIIAYSVVPGRDGFKSVKCLFTSSEKTQPINSHQIVGTWMELEGNRMRLRNDNGISIGMERERLRILGNAVVPQVAQKVGEMILAYEKSSLDKNRDLI
jgi:DNA (cytosine-5)-methyltransferase 1